MSAPHDTRQEVELPPMDLTEEDRSATITWERDVVENSVNDAVPVSWLACRERQLLSALSTLRGLEEENARLKADKENWRSLSKDFQERLHEVKAELATLRASQRTGDDGWIEIKEGCELPPYGVPVWVVLHGVVQHVAYSRDIGEWNACTDDSNAAPDGTFSHWRPIPAPSETGGDPR